MKTLTHPRWLLFTGVLPLLLLAFFAYRQYTLIESLLEADVLARWRTFGIVLAAFSAGIGAVALGLLATRRRISVVVAGSVFLVSMAFLFWSVTYGERLVPWSVPRWLRGDVEFLLKLLLGTMPLLVHTLLVTVHHTTPEVERQRVLPNFVWAVAIPAVAYLLVTIVLPWFNGPGERFWGHVFVVLVVILTVLFLFFLLRALYIVSRQRRTVIGRFRLLWLIPLAIIFPLAGLALNNGHLLGVDMNFGEEVFGDFSHPAFYLIAGLNGLALCLPAYPNRLYRLFLYLVRMAGLTFIAYFFLVFLPFLPLSIGAILVFGLGFLMLTPLMLLPVQLTKIREDYAYLRSSFSSAFLGATGAVALLLLPLTLNFFYLSDQRALTEALDYIYAPSELPAGQQINKAALTRVLTKVEGHKRGRRGRSLFGSGTPYLSSYYRWLVLDDLTLSDAKLTDLRRIFLGTAPDPVNTLPRFERPRPELTDITVSSSWEADQQAWSTWVELEMTNDSTGQFAQAEYITDFVLPPGVFIADYFLDVEGRREPGILAERKAATWVYNQIVGTRRDPGLLRYLSADRLELKVFPFSSGEVRRTGFRLLHKEPVSFAFDGRTVQAGRVGEHALPADYRVTENGVTYLSAAAKEALPTVRRRGRLHFVVDGSRQHRDREEEMVSAIERFVATHDPDGLTPRVVVAGTYPKDVAPDQLLATLRATPEGGFFAQRAVADILREEFLRPADEEYPIVVLVDAGNEPVFTDELSAFRSALPEAPFLYRMDLDGNLRSYRLEAPERVVEQNASLPQPSLVYAYPTREDPRQYLPPVPGPAVIVTPAPDTPAERELAQGNWSDALQLRGTYLANRWHRQTVYRPWLAEVRGSFQTGVLMPTTAYLVVENEAQKEALRRKQAQTLRADPSFDAGEEEPQRMSEPGWWLFLLILLLPVQRYRRQRQG